MNHETIPPPHHPPMSPSAPFMCFHVFTVLRTHRLIGSQLLLIIGFREDLPISLSASGSNSLTLPISFRLLRILISAFNSSSHTSPFSNHSSPILLFIFRTYIAYNRYEYAVSIVHAVNNLTRSRQDSSFGLSVCHEE